MAKNGGYLIVDLKDTLTTNRDDSYTNVVNASTELKSAWGKIKNILLENIKKGNKPILLLNPYGIQDDGSSNYTGVSIVSPTFGACYVDDTFVYLVFLGMYGTIQISITRATNEISAIISAI